MRFPKRVSRMEKRDPREPHNGQWTETFSLKNDKFMRFQKTSTEDSQKREPRKLQNVQRIETFSCGQNDKLLRFPKRVLRMDKTSKLLKFPKRVPKETHNGWWTEIFY